MSSQRAIRRTLSLIVALSVVLWAGSGLAMLAADYGAECHARMFPTQQQAHTVPCCPSRASVPPSLIQAPPCCDLSSQPERPLAFLATSGKSHPNQFSAHNAACALFEPAPRKSAVLLVVDSPSFVKPVFDKKTDLRI